MGESCSARVSDEKCVQILVGNLKGRDISEDLGVDGRIL
jgi:hypothetical protein